MRCHWEINDNLSDAQPLWYCSNIGVVLWRSLPSGTWQMVL